MVCVGLNKDMAIPSVPPPGSTLCHPLTVPCATP